MKLNLLFLGSFEGSISSRASACVRWLPCVQRSFTLSLIAKHFALGRFIEQHTGISIQSAIEKGFPAYAERVGGTIWWLVDCSGSQGKSAKGKRSFGMNTCTKTSRVVLSINTWDPKNINLEWFDLTLSTLQSKRLTKEWDVAPGLNTQHLICVTRWKASFHLFQAPNTLRLVHQCPKYPWISKPLQDGLRKSTSIPSIPVKYHKIFRPCLVLFLVFFSKGKILAVGSPNPSQFGRRLWFSPEVKDMCPEQTNQSAAGTWRLQILGILPV